MILAMNGRPFAGMAQPTMMPIIILDAVISPCTVPARTVHAACGEDGRCRITSRCGHSLTLMGCRAITRHIILKQTLKRTKPSSMIVRPPPLKRRKDPSSRFLRVHWQNHRPGRTVIQVAACSLTVEVVVLQTGVANFNEIGSRIACIESQVPGPYLA
jgi:hypothetical protein